MRYDRVRRYEIENYRGYLPVLIVHCVDRVSPPSLASGRATPESGPPSMSFAGSDCQSR